MSRIKGARNLDSKSEIKINGIIAQHPDWSAERVRIASGLKISQSTVRVLKEKATPQMAEPSFKARLQP